MALRRANGANELTNLRVLIVDDNLDNQALMNETLTREGLSVALASSGREALDRFLQRRPLGQSMFEGERVLNIAQPGMGGGVRVCALEAYAGSRIVRP